jgi:hypothetical protein
MKKMPKIRFVSSVGEYIWHPNDYLIRESYQDLESDIKENDSFSFGFLPGKSIILGATFMRNYEIQFDMDTGKTMFSRANCS